MSGVIEDTVRMLTAPISDKQDNILNNDPTEYLPVMRHHLHEGLWALNMALNYIRATDLADSYRQGSQVPIESSLARSLDRSCGMLSGYLGLSDDGVSDGEIVSEDE